MTRGGGSTSAASMAAFLKPRRWSRKNARGGAARPVVAAAGLAAATLAALVVRHGQAFVPSPSVPASRGATVGESSQEEALGRRTAFSAALTAGLWGNVGVVGGGEAWASGGSTAGKYSTIPSAKRRFYGRVREGIYEFLQMEKPILNGELQDPAVSGFFAKSIVKQKGGEKMSSCAIDFGGGTCVTKEKRTSRWLDFKVASDLLASAFRYSADEVNDYLPQVKLIRACAKKVEKMQTAINNGDADTAKELFKKAKTDLNKYVPMVELSPLDSEDYTHPWETRPTVFCTGTYCS